MATNVIDLLERFGQDAELHHASREMLEEALRSAGIDPELRAAILGKDSRALEALIGVEPNVCCAVFKEDEDDKDKDKEDKEKDKDKDKEEEDKKK